MGPETGEGQKGLAQKIEAVKVVAGAKEAERQRLRTEAAEQRRENWNNLISGAKNKINQFRDWDRQAGADLRKVVDMTPGVIGAVALTGQEKMVEARNAADELATWAVERAQEVGTAIGGAVVRGAETAGGIAVGAGVLAAEGAVWTGKKLVKGAEIGLHAFEVSVETGVNFVEDSIDFAFDTAEDIGGWVSEQGRKIRDGAEELRQSADESFRNAVDKTKAKFNEKRQKLTTSFQNTRAEVSGRITRTIERGKNRVIRFQEDTANNLHDAIAGVHSFEHKLASGALGVLERMAGKVSEIDQVAVEKRDKELGLKIVRLDVAAVFAEGSERVNK